jgi:hypothetical protein
MTRSDEQRQQIRALLEQRDELTRQRAALERELAAELAKLTPRQREIIEARWAKRGPAQPLQ